MLLQILDKAWKEHLYAMDQIKDSVGLRGYAEKDPRIEYKREGANQFASMQRSVQDQVTDLIFRARLTPNVRLPNANPQQQAHQAPAGTTAAGPAVPAPPPASATVAAAAASQAQGTAEQQADREAADRAGSQDDPNLSRKQRRAAEARQRHEQASGPKKQRKRKDR